MPSPPPPPTSLPRSTKGPDGCRSCKGPDACEECAKGVLDAKTKTCTPCQDANCWSCPADVGTCEECAWGSVLLKGACAACEVANCESW